MGFVLPLVLLALLLVPLLGWWLGSRRRRQVARLVGALGPRADSLSSGARGPEVRWVFLLRCSTLAATLLAVAQPQWGRDERADRAARLDLVVCLDVSRSMLARDVAPSRMEAARAAVRALAERARGDRLALVAFAGAARLCIPLTSDAETFSELLGGIDELAIARGGTDLAAALETALGALVGGSTGRKLVILLTDGDDPGRDAWRAAERCRAQGIVVHVAGYGSERGGKIPIETDAGKSYLRDGSGDEVVSALDLAGLRAIAEVADGEYVVGSGRDELADLYERRIAPAANDVSTGGETTLANRFQWPLLLAIIGALCELAWAVRRPRS